MFDANKNINVSDASIQGDQCDYLSVVFPVDTSVMYHLRGLGGRRLWELLSIL